MSYSTKGHLFWSEFVVRYRMISNFVIWFRYNRIGLSGKFVPMLKENWNAKNLNFSTFIKLYRLVGTNFSDNPILCGKLDWLSLVWLNIVRGVSVPDPIIEVICHRFYAFTSFLSIKLVVTTTNVITHAKTSPKSIIHSKHIT